MNRNSKFMILDGYSTRTLACTRSFGKHCIPFIVGGETKWDMSLFSRYCKEKFVYTSPNINISRFIVDINHNIKKFNIDVILPTSEAAIIALDSNRENIEAELLMPTSNEIKILFNKKNTLNLAKSLGLRIPSTHYVNGSQIEDIDKSRFEFPLIIKSEKRITKCQNILIQEFVNGYGVGISGIFKKGEPVALIGHKRIRESNPLGGPSSVAESIDISAELMESTKKIMKKIGYTGPAMVEYKIDRETSLPVLMEINARFWGSILLPQAAGLDLPYLYWKTINNLKINHDEILYKKGIKGRSLIGDTKSFFLIIKGKPKLWPGYFPNRWESSKDYMSLFFTKNSKNLLLCKDDPAPFYRRVLYEMMIRLKRSK